MAATPLVRIDRYLAAPMFGVSAIYLLLLAGVLHLHDSKVGGSVWHISLWGIAALHTLFVLEAAAHVALGGRFWKRYVCYCLVPPARLCARDHTTGSEVWLPWLGWSTADDRLRSRLEKVFGVPMILIALMVLPLLAIEHFWSHQIQTNDELALSVQLGTALIWAAFTAEFVVMISVVEKRIVYCRQHWIDLAVILLPLIAFLRAARLGRLLRLHQLSKTARVFRLKGLALKAWRSLLLLDVIDRIIRGTPEVQLEKLKLELEAKEEELTNLRDRIAAIESSIPKEAETGRRRRAA